MRAAVGLEERATRSCPIAHSPALETPPAGAVARWWPTSLVRWTPQGASPVRPTDQDAAAIGRALGLVRREETLARLAVQNGTGFLGSSERFLVAAGVTGLDRRARKQTPP